MKNGLIVNYFANLGMKCHFPKLGCSKSSFLKRRGCQCNLLKKKMWGSLGVIYIIFFFSHFWSCYYRFDWISNPMNRYPSQFGCLIGPLMQLNKTY